MKQLEIDTQYKEHLRLKDLQILLKWRKTLTFDILKN